MTENWNTFIRDTPQPGKQILVQVANFVQIREDRYDVAGLEEHPCVVDECGTLRHLDGSILHMDIRGKAGKVAVQWKEM